MENTNTTLQENEIDKAFESLPEEVQDFLSSPLFEAIILAIQENLSLTDNQRDIVKYIAYELLMKTMTPEEGLELLKNNGLTEDSAIKTMYALDSEVLIRAANITEFYTDEVEVGLEDGSTNVPSPDMKNLSLASLADRLKQASIAAPANRSEYGLNKPVSPTPAVETSSPAIDPYHEPIDNE